MIREKLTWTCHVCGDERPDRNVSVYSLDISAEHGLREGIMVQNVRYCKDRPRCVRRAPKVRLVPSTRPKVEGNA